VYSKRKREFRATVVDVLIKQLKQQQQLAELQLKRCWLLFFQFPEWEDEMKRDG